MNKKIKLRVLCSQESFRCEFVARLLTFYGICNKESKQNILSEDEVIERLENEELKDLCMRFWMGQYEFEILWRDDEENEDDDGDGILYLLLLQLREQVSQGMLQRLKSYEIQRNSMFVIVDKISNSSKDMDLQQYQNVVLDLLNSNLNVLIEQDHILTVLIEKSQKSRKLICQKFSEVIGDFFGIKKNGIDEILIKICGEYGIEKMEQFIEEVKKGDFLLGCSKVKDRKIRKILMERLKSFKQLNQIILGNKKCQMKNVGEIQGRQNVNELKKLRKVQSQNCQKKIENNLGYQEVLKKSESVKQSLNEESKQFEDIISSTLSGKSGCQKLNVSNKNSCENLIELRKSVTESNSYSKYRKTFDSISQLKWAVSQDLLEILKKYVEDPEMYLDSLFEDKSYEVLKKVKRSQQHIFLERINTCQSYQQYLNVINQSKGRQTMSSDTVSKDFQKKVLFGQLGSKKFSESARQSILEQVKCKIVKQIKKEDDETLLKQTVLETETEGKFDQKGNRYVGQYQNGLRNGKGKLYYANGDKYTGEFRNGLREGIGIYEFADGNRYDGEFKKDKRDGKGIFIFNNGGIYDGQWKNHVRQGKGTFEYGNGEKYEGEWRGNKREGKGRYFYENGSLFYEGQWKNDQKQGQGILYFVNGSYYEGELKNGKRDGEGILYRANGQIYYDGKWKDDLKHGLGTVFSAEGSVYTGEWQCNEKHGYGIEQYTDGNKFEGEWRNDRIEGKGTKHYAYGGRYEAIWENGQSVKRISEDEYDGGRNRNGLREGVGVELYGNGDMYIGEWKNDLKEGQGTYFYNDGTKYQGDWKRDQKSGNGVITYDNDYQYSGQFRNDKRHGFGVETDPYGGKTQGRWENDNLVKMYFD